MDGRAVRHTALALLLAATAERSGCRVELGGPDDAARSVVGAGADGWSFLVADAGTLAPGDGPVGGAHVHGVVPCPGELRVTRQSRRSIAGTFDVGPSPGDECWSGRPGFCAAAGARAFCRPVHGTFDGVVGGVGRDVTVRFRLHVRGQDGRASLAEVIGCPIVAGDESFVGTIAGRALVGADARVTVECPASSGFGRVDVSLSVPGARR